MKTNNQAFKALQAKWYKKLKDSGFKDVEQDEKFLKHSDYAFLKYGDQRGKLFGQAKEEYYRLAGMFLYDFSFTDKYDRLIWELHASGDSQTTIVKKLNQKHIKIHQTTVCRQLQNLKEKMLEFYKRPQND